MKGISLGTLKYKRRLLNMARALEAAKPLVRTHYVMDDGKYTFICHALNAVRHTDEAATFGTGSNDAQNLVMRALSSSGLGYHSTLNAWLQSKHKRDFSYDEAQLHRHRWIDKLIHDIEKHAAKLGGHPPFNGVRRKS